MIKKFEWTLSSVPISKLIDWDKNPRNMTKRQSEKLVESLDKFGVCQPIVVNKDFKIIGGHQRVRAARELNIESIDVYMPDRKLTKKEFEELNIRLNKNSGFFDYDTLANSFCSVELVEWGFSLDEFEVESQPFDDSEKEEKPKKSRMTITFQNEEDLQSAENKIATIVDAIEGASYKIKVGV